MTPVIFINCKKQPFIDQIIAGDKIFETRTRNTLGRMLGNRVLLAETGSGRPLVRCSAKVKEIIAVYTREAWSKYTFGACIQPGSEYDWKTGTKVKWLYWLTDVTPCDPFTPPEGRRHGRVWMEYND